MSSVFVYVIVDFLSERIVNTFYSPNDVFASRSFANFLDGLKGRVKPSDFALMCCGSVSSVPESYKECLDMAASDKKYAFLSGIDCLSSENQEELEDESEN